MLDILYPCDGTEQAQLTSVIISDDQQLHIELTLEALGPMYFDVTRVSGM